jgi:predicted nucleic acid-binding Zn ribbon protein
MKQEQLLICGHCSCKFEGSASQVKHVKYEKSVAYCSDTCRRCAMQNKFRTQIPNRGPCKTCGKEFVSRTAKIYCCMDCYLKSKQFAAMLKSNRDTVSGNIEAIANRAAHRKRGKDVNCPECGNSFYQKRAAKGRIAQKFCCRSCYRAYMAKRFDRYIASPQSLALPQCYDEFLNQHELHCPFEGCDWVGKKLSMHVNIAHGVKQKDFKKAAGFNLSTGVVSKDLAEKFRRRNDKAKLPADYTKPLQLAHIALKNRKETYRSLEALEHQKKAIALSGIGPERNCASCGEAFLQTTRYGRALYCSKKCRDDFYRHNKRFSKSNPAESEDEAA